MLIICLVSPCYEIITFTNSITQAKQDEIFFRQIQSRILSIILISKFEFPPRNETSK